MSAETLAAALSEITKVLAAVIGEDELDHDRILDAQNIARQALAAHEQEQQDACSECGGSGWYPRDPNCPDPWHGGHIEAHICKPCPRCKGGAK